MFLAQGVLGLLVYVRVAYHIIASLKSGSHNSYDKVRIQQTLIGHATQISSKSIQKKKRSVVIC